MVAIIINSIYLSISKGFEQRDNLLRVHRTFEYLTNRIEYLLSEFWEFDGRMIGILFIQQVISMDLFACRDEGITA